MVLWADGNVTHVLALTPCENICLINYANVAIVVSTFLLTTGGGAAAIRPAQHYHRYKVLKAFISEGLKCVCVIAPKKKAAVNVWNIWHVCKYPKSITMVAFALEIQSQMEEAMKDKQGTAGTYL